MSERASIAPIVRFSRGESSTDQDLVAAESPLEVWLEQLGTGRRESIGLVMRTPGDDRDLVTGLLISEQIVTAPDDLVDVVFEWPDAGAPAGPSSRPQQARVTLAAHVDLDAVHAARALDRTSACGMCGRLALQAVEVSGGRAPDTPRLDPDVIAGIPDRLREAQAVFSETGGLHAAALCDLAGVPWLVREDVGRHNAVDKVIGAAFAAGRWPARDQVLAVSGRIAYEIVQKAAVAGVAAIVAVGAPTSLAVEAARAVGLTLAGFTRGDRFNVYTGAGRVRRAGE